MDFGKHMLYIIWRVPRDQNESNDEWATISRELANMFPQLDVFVLVNDGLPLP